MSNVIPFRSRAPHGTAHVATQVPLYRLALARAKARGVCPEPANDTGACELPTSRVAPIPGVPTICVKPPARVR